MRHESPQLPWRPLATATALAAAIALGACSGESTGPGANEPPAELTALPRALTAMEQQAISASNNFGLSLLGQVAQAESGRNVVLSPLSASVALGMAYAGAESLTADSMQRALGWGSAARDQVLAGYRDLPTLLSGLDSRVQFTSANAMWVRDGYPILPGYSSEVRQVFGADVRNGDFGPTTVADMNQWARDRTNGKIEQVVESLPDGMVAMLMNALYFKGNWRDQFDPARTQTRTFTPSVAAAQPVPMMSRSGDMLVGRASGATWAELPYGNGAFAMTLALPPAGTAVSAWLATLTADSLAAAVAGIGEGKADLLLPKFRLSVGFELEDALTTMGMRRAFDRQTAEFGRIGPGDVHLTGVKQDVFIEVNEEGTEAAAVTQVEVGVTSAPLVVQVHLDRPFVFFIRERLSGTILFAGVIENPALQE